MTTIKVTGVINYLHCPESSSFFSIDSALPHVYLFSLICLHIQKCIDQRPNPATRSFIKLPSCETQNKHLHAGHFLTPPGDAEYVSINNSLPPNQNLLIKVKSRKKKKSLSVFQLCKAQTVVCWAIQRKFFADQQVSCRVEHFLLHTGRTFILSQFDFPLSFLRCGLICVFCYTDFGNVAGIF